MCTCPNPKRMGLPSWRSPHIHAISIVTAYWVLRRLGSCHFDHSGHKTEWVVRIILHDPRHFQFRHCARDQAEWVHPISGHYFREVCACCRQSLDEFHDVHLIWLTASQSYNSFILQQLQIELHKYMCGAVQYALNLLAARLTFSRSAPDLLCKLRMCNANLVIWHEISWIWYCHLSFPFNSNPSGKASPLQNQAFFHVQALHWSVYSSARPSAIWRTICWPLARMTLSSGP